MSHLKRLTFTRLALSLLTLGLTLGAVSSDAYAKKKRGARGIQFANQGQITIGGSASYTSPSVTGVSKGDEGDSADGPSTFMIAPRVGYFVWSDDAMGLEIAGELMFSRSDTDNGAAGEVKTSMFSFGVDPTLYFKAMKRNGLFPFVHLGLAYALNGSETSIGDTTVESQSSGLDITPGAGFTFNIGKKRGAFIRTELNYEMTERLNEDENGLKTSGLALRVGFGAFW